MGKIGDQYNNNLNLNLDLQKLNWKVLVSEQSISLIAQLLIFFICGLKIIDGTLTIGKFTMILAYFNMYLSSAKYFYSLKGSLQSIRV